MTRIFWCGQRWNKISSQAWRDLGGEGNPYLLRLKDRKKEGCHKHFIRGDKA